LDKLKRDLQNSAESAKSTATSLRGRGSLRIKLAAEIDVTAGCYKRLRWITPQHAIFILGGEPRIMATQ